MLMFAWYHGFFQSSREQKFRNCDVLFKNISWIIYQISLRAIADKTQNVFVFIAFIVCAVCYSALVQEYVDSFVEFVFTKYFIFIPGGKKVITVIALCEILVSLSILIFIDTYVAGSVVHAFGKAKGG